MTIENKFRAIIVAVCVWSISLFGIEPVQHLSEIRSGIVLYDITSETVLTPETNLSIKGEGKLCFEEWGDVRYETENNEALTSGAIKHKHQVKRFKKYTKEIITTVDYENQQLLERKNPIGATPPNQTDFLKNTGQEEIAGVICDVWEGAGIKKCIYKGIVLKAESKVLDVSYVKVAKSAVFDINASGEACTLPNFPVQEFALIQDSVTTTNTAKPKKFSLALKDVAYDINENNSSNGDNNITDEERIKFINYVGQDIFTSQKELLPALLTAMKESRECLQAEEDPIIANQCMESFNFIKEYMEIKEKNTKLLWNSKKKSDLLDKIEDDLIDLESRIACVNRAKNITDLSACMK